MDWNCLFTEDLPRGAVCSGPSEASPSVCYHFFNGFRGLRSLVHHTFLVHTLHHMCCASYTAVWTHCCFKALPLLHCIIPQNFNPWSKTLACLKQSSCHSTRAGEWKRSSHRVIYLTGTSDLSHHHWKEKQPAVSTQCYRELTAFSRT